MIKIMTKDGISLDLAPDAEFVIEYNNPMMEDDRIPVPFSTSIALLPSATNCKVLRYLPALKLEPTVKKLAASLVFNGIPFLTGILIYDGIEDGNLNYTFSGRDLGNDWGVKIWEMSVGEYVGGRGAVAGAFTSRYDGIFWPLLVNKDYTGYFVEGQDDVFNVQEYNKKLAAKVEKNVKYHNFMNVIPESGTSRLTPAVSVSKIVSGRFSASEDIGVILPKVVIVGQYQNGSGVALVPVEVAKSLPDYTFVEFVQELAKMFCAAFYEDGAGQYVMISAETILSASSYNDWTDKVADTFSSEKEESSGYSFGYENSGEDSFDDITELGKVDSFKASIYPCDDAPESSTLFVNVNGTVKVSGTGVCVSANSLVADCWISISDTESKKGKVLVSAADVVFQNNNTQENAVEDADVIENRCGFNLIKCVPSILSYYEKAIIDEEKFKVIKGLVQRFSMAGVIEPQNADAERGTDVYVGLINNGQISDSGYVLASDAPEDYPSLDEIAAMTDVPLIPEGSTEPISLRPDWLYEHFHKRYAQWLATDRQVISCDVNLNEFDLLNFRMYNKVRLHGRDFFVKKLSVTLRAGSEALECSADFISA